MNANSDASAVKTGNPDFKKTMDLIAATENKERENALAHIKAETNPEEIIRRVQTHHSQFLRGGNTDQEVKLSAIQNPNTPTILLLLLYYSPIDSPPGFPTVTKEIREAAIEKLKARNWELGEWEKKTFSPEALFVLEHALEADRLKYETENIGSIKTANQTPLEELLKQLITLRGLPSRVIHVHGPMDV